VARPEPANITNSMAENSDEPQNDLAKAPCAVADTATAPSVLTTVTGDNDEENDDNNEANKSGIHADSTAAVAVTNAAPMAFSEASAVEGRDYYEKGPNNANSASAHQEPEHDAHRTLISSPPLSAAPSSSLATSNAASALLSTARRNVEQLSSGGSYHANAFLAAASSPSSRSLVVPSIPGLSQAAAAAVANAPAERRGSGFLLLAAEAYEAAERTQLRADAIRQVAMELASAAGAAAAASSSDAAESGESRLQRQYEDALLARQAGQPQSSFLQGLAASGNIQQQPQPQHLYSSYGARESAYPEMDGNFREQVYMAAARMQQQQQQQQHHQQNEQQATEQVQATKVEAPAATASPQAEREEGNANSASKQPQEPKKRRRRSSLLKAKDTPKCEPPLPPAPLIPPTKQPSAKKKRSSTGSVDSTTASSSKADLLPSGKPRPKPQKHVYHDYSAIPDSEHFVRKKTGGVTMPFPEKLMHMLDKESLLNPDVISWQSHGRAFTVRKPKDFTSRVMGGYFRQSKLTSFQRQLNLYGFRRITQGTDAGAYYHELFLRGRPQLCMRMQRQKVKGTGHKQPTDVTSEPNFYVMPPVIAEGTVSGGAASAAAVAGEDATSDAPPRFSSTGSPPSSLHDSTALLSPDSHEEKKTTLTGISLSKTAPASPPSTAQLIHPFNSPGICAATMLRKLATSKVTMDPPLFDLDAGVSTHAVASSSPTSTRDEVSPPLAPRVHGFQPPIPPPSSLAASAATLGSCAKANAAALAMASMGSGLDSGSRRSSTSTSSKEDLQKVEYV